MIGRLTGLVEAIGGDAAIVDVGGVGYLVHCSARSLAAATGKGVTRLDVETQMREDAIVLYAFALPGGYVYISRGLLASLLAKPASARPSLGHVLTTPLIQCALPPPAPPPTSSSTATEPAPTAPGSTAASVASDASSAAAPRFPKGSRVMVKRTSGQESVGVVDKHDPGLNLYSLTLVDKEGKVEGTKRARETDLRAAETALEKQLMELHGRMEDQARRQSGGTPARGSQQPPLKRTPSRGGIAAGADAHAAAAVLQRSFQRRRPVPPPMPAPERLMTPAALLAQQHVRQQRQQQLNRQQQAHRVPPSTAAGRPVESLKEQQRRLAGKGLGQGYYQLKPTPFRPLV